MEVPALNAHQRIPAPALLASLVAAIFTGCAVQPVALTAEERQASITADLSAMFATQEPVQGAVTLEEAMARAIKYNLDHRLKLMEEAVSQRQLDL